MSSGIEVDQTETVHYSPLMNRSPRHAVRPAKGGNRRAGKRLMRPIFIVGSPRSGTSILTWCLGQHSNIFLQEESNWMGDFAQQIAIAYRIGTARGERSQLSRLGVRSEDFFALFGQSINRLILDFRQNLEARVAEARALGRGERLVNPPSFQITRSNSDSKERWVVGTPEYSFSICALRKLFPNARFIHVVRHVDDAVSSMVHFERVAGTKLVSCAREGYEYWIRSVRACLAAEKAYGPTVVHRLFHHELTCEPQKALRAVLDFVGEEFSQNCVEPLAVPINSSRVTSRASEASDTESDIRSEARQLWQEVSETPAPKAPSPEAAEALERSFAIKVEYAFNLNSEHTTAQRRIEELQKELAEHRGWAIRSNQQLARRDERVLQLQEEVATRNEWARNLSQEIARMNRFIVQLQGEFAERSTWALELQAESASKDALILDLQAQLQETARPKSNVVSND
jgi:chemotaxis protein histidine kinase CheA